MYGIAMVALLMAPSVSRAQIYIASDGTTDLLTEYSLSGAAIHPVASPLDSGLTAPQGITISGNEVYVAEGNGVGEYSANNPGVGNPSLISLSNAAVSIVAAGSNLFIGTANGSIYEYNDAGASVVAGGNPLITGLGNGDLTMAVSGTNLFVADNSTVGGVTGSFAEYSAITGAKVSSFSVSTPTQNPRGVAISGSNVFVSNPTSGTGKVFEYSITGNGQAPSGAFAIAAATGIATLGGNLYVLSNSTSANTLTQVNLATDAASTIITGLPANTYESLVAIPEPPVGAGLIACAAVIFAFRFRERRTG